MNKSARIISNVVYGIGVAMVATLVFVALFGSNQVTNPDAMIPYTWKELAFMWLAIGTLPMLLACMAVYRYNEIKNSTNKKRNFLLIFLPGFICGACAMFIIGLLIYEFVRSILLY
ncbi:MAG: hypothetical protein GXX10_02760 [Clostridiaceae bacterium]|nr:hypothetical protein [Clostridiaceae bacterium]